MGVNYWLLTLTVLKRFADLRDWLLFLWWPQDEHVTVPGMAAIAHG